QYPVEIVYETDAGDSTVTIINEDEMLAAKAACRAEDDDHHRKCFALILPASFTMPDGSTITVETDEDYMLLRTWYADHPDAAGHPALQYPVEIVYETDAGDSTVTIINEDEMMAAKAACRGDDRPPVRP
ncbi:hypothetical protein HQ531_00825, partial [bacterium]|nr:hypothetical protein [bacterium]